MTNKLKNATILALFLSTLGLASTANASCMIAKSFQGYPCTNAVINIQREAAGWYGNPSEEDKRNFDRHWPAIEKHCKSKVGTNDWQQCTRDRWNAIK